MDDPIIYWPFASLKVEKDRNSFDHDFIHFMVAAYAENYRPRCQLSTIVVGEPTSRLAQLVWRGGYGYEPYLVQQGQSVRLGPSYGMSEVACICVRPPFSAAGYFALEWLRGSTLESLLADYEFVNGYPAGIILRSAHNLTVNPERGPAPRFDAR